MTYLLMELWLFLIVSCVLGFAIGWWCRQHFVERPRVRAWEKRYNDANEDRQGALQARNKAQGELSELTATHEKCAPEIAGHLKTIADHEETIAALRSEKSALQEELHKGNQLLIALKNAESDDSSG